jgi:hypothetical protein
MRNKAWDSLTREFARLKKEIPALGYHIAFLVLLLTIAVFYEWLPPGFQHIALTIFAILTMHLIDYYLLSRRLLSNIQLTLNGCLDSPR